MKSRRRFSRGFSLFEVLIALAIVVILMATLSSVIGIAWDQKRAAERAVENVRDTQTIGDVLVEELRNALPPFVDEVAAAAAATQPGTVDTETPIVDHIIGPFRGDQTSVLFYVSGDDFKSEIKGGVRCVYFALASGYSEDGLESLVRRSESNLLRPDWFVDDPDPSGLEDEVLINHVVELSFQYTDVDGNLFSTWYSEDHENTLPYAVVIDLTLAAPGDNRENRVIHRVASIICAAPPFVPPTDPAATQSSSGISF